LNRNQILLKNTILYFIGSFSSSVLSFLLLPLYTRYLSPEDYGFIDIIFAISFVVTPIITLQISFACYRYLFDINDIKDRKAIISNSFAVFCIGNIIFIALYSLAISFVQIQYDFVIMLYIVVSGGAGFVQTLARGLRKNSLFSLLGVLSTVVSIIANIVFIVGLNFKSLSLLLAPICSSLVVVIVSLFKLNIATLIDFSLVNKMQIKSLLRYSTPLIPDAICWWLLLGFGRVYLNYQSGAEAVGVLAIASKFPSLLTSFYAIFNLAWKENAITEYTSQDRDSYYSYIYNNQAVIILSGIIVLLPLTRLSIKYLLAPSFQGAYAYIPMLFLASALDMLAVFWSSGFESAKKTKGILVSTLIAFVVNFILNIILVPYISVFGVVAANFGSFGIMLLVRIVRSRKFFTITVDIKKIIPLVLGVFLFSGLYYLDNMIIQCILLIIGIIIFIVFNLLTIKKIFLLIKGMLVREKCSKLIEAK